MTNQVSPAVLTALKRTLFSDFSHVIAIVWMCGFLFLLYFHCERSWACTVVQADPLATTCHWRVMEDKCGKKDATLKSDPGRWEILLLEISAAYGANWSSFQKLQPQPWPANGVPRSLLVYELWGCCTLFRTVFMSIGSQSRQQSCLWRCERAITIL